MAASAQRLLRHGIPMYEYTQTLGNLTDCSQNLYDLIKGRNLLAYPDEQIRLAISRAIAIEKTRGWHIGKYKQTHKIDIVVSLAMASLAAVRSQATAGFDMDTYSLAYGDGTEVPDADGARAFRQARLDEHILKFAGHPNYARRHSSET